MANGKKGFVLYADQKELFEQLPNEKAGELIKHIFRYVNDEQPETDDLVIRLAFTPIKQQLKRDLEKWNTTRKVRSEAGKAGAKSRWQKIAKDGKRISSMAKMAVNDTVTVNVKENVNVNDILLEKETKELFNDWMDYRKEIKKPIKSQKTKIALAKKMTLEGYEKSKNVISQSIQSGWQGLFWDKEVRKINVVEPTTVTEMLKKKHNL